MNKSLPRQSNINKAIQEDLAEGEWTDPIVPRIDLESLAGPVIYKRTEMLESINQLCTTVLRGKTLTFQASSKRLLWQALGQEYIEPELLDYIDCMQRGSVFYDVGASNGIFSIYAAATDKDVYCFEPEVANFSLLNHNTYLNRLQFTSPMKNFNIALSEKNELGKLFIKKFEAGGHLKIMDSPVQRGALNFEADFIQSVIKYRLDDFIQLTAIPPPNHIKIDVDGSELQVVHGMLGTLKSNALETIFIEFELDNPQSAACEKIILESGFTLEKKKRVQNYFGENNCIYRR